MRLSWSTMGFCFAAQFPPLYQQSAERASNGYVSKNWQFGVISASVADYRVHVLRHHAKQVGTADLSAWLHEEPPGLPSRPPRTSVALLQLHVHARWVRSRTSMLISAGLVQVNSDWLLRMMHRKEEQIYCAVIWILFSFLSSVWSSWGSMLYCSWWLVFLWRWSMASYE